MPQSIMAKKLPILTKSIFHWTGQVTHGQSMGRTIGFPTANIDLVPSEVDLKPGVYLASCQFKSTPEQHYGLVYFGPKLVLGQTTNVFEIYLFDFEQQIYGQTLTIDLQQYIREPKKFTDFADLKNQLTFDYSQAKLYLK